jgi:plasmid stabilization system protein ParE
MGTNWREELADKPPSFSSRLFLLDRYRHETKPLQIVPVLHAARDVQSILGLTHDER